MKICHITDYLPSCHNKFGGAEQAVEKIVNLEHHNKINNYLST